MSFGFGIGDFIAIGNLAWAVYRKCKGLTDEFKDVSNEALTVHTVVLELQEEAQDERSLLNLQGVSRKQELLLLIRNLEGVLRELDAFIKEYEGHTRRERRIFKQFKLATEDLGQFRRKLSFHVTAINVFMQSLSRSNLARIEVVLHELIREVREGRRPPSIASIDDRVDNPVWKELEAELAEDGISSAEVSKHKLAIKTFVQTLLSSSNADGMSLYEVASIVESNNDREDLESSSAPTTASSSPSRSFSWGSSGKGTSFSSSKASEGKSTMDLSSWESSPFCTPAAPPASSPGMINSKERVIDSLEEAGGIKSCYEPPILSNECSRNIYDNRYSEDSAKIGPRKKVLLLDQTHSCISKLAHAYMQSLIKSYNIIREHVESVESAGWRTARSNEPERWSVDSMVKELLIREKLEIPRWTRRAATFESRDVFRFDNIVYFDASTFEHTFEDYLRSCVSRQVSESLENKEAARLTMYNVPAFIQIPEFMFRVQGSNGEFFRNRQQIALDAIWLAVQTSILEFLEKEYGLKRAGPNFEGFEKIAIST